jgi:hypothetical protein
MAASFRVTVSDPQRQGEGMAAFVSYKVTTQLSQAVPGLEAQVYANIRRFNDFVWLRGQLRDALPYVIVPALPEKQQVRGALRDARRAARGVQCAVSGAPRLTTMRPSSIAALSSLAPRLPSPLARRSGASATTSSRCGTARCSAGSTAWRRTRR